ncbi:hypothetical protein KY290_027467 [Solanum tuberosum]|uniref:DUF4283 domain-containing protein n=1 Tax=Solanum tuberosum TaxID=4113 RepID=A0ABQ7UF41_SOLTU|nr:hypothetical protein KY290_027467 [Solanum tuberosum]
MDEQGMEVQSEQGNNETRKSQNDQHDPTKLATLDVIDVESSSHLSFGVKAVDTTPSNTGQGNKQQAPCRKPNIQERVTLQQEQSRRDSKSQQQAEQRNEKNMNQAHTTHNQKSQQINQPNQVKGTSNTNEVQAIKQDQITEPAPYTVVQTLATRLRQIHVAHATLIELVPPRHTTKQSQPAVIYDMNDFMKKLVVDCKYTIIGKFSATMPKEETPIVPIWVLLPGLPWHCFKKQFITPLLESVGKVLYLDTTSIKRTRASMAKVKVQVDLTKTKPRHVWIGLDDEDLTIGRWQPIEYENIPPYCPYCRHQGHMIDECNFKIRDEEFNKRKELDTEKKNINKREQGQQGSENRQARTKEQEEQQYQNNKEGSNQQQPEQQKEEEWQVQKRRNNKPHEEKRQKTI